MSVLGRNRKVWDGKVQKGIIILIETVRVRFIGKWFQGISHWNSLTIELVDDAGF
jgi:hypothetical protein